MSRKRFLIILAVLVVAGVAFFIISPKLSKKTPKIISTPTPSVEEQLQDKFKGLSIPDDTERIELKNVSGTEAMGMAGKNEIVADLPELSPSEEYRVLLGNGTKTVLLGVMKQAKGGWILEYDLSRYPDYKEISIVKGSSRILEGTFK
jgi:hypothetical protein